MPVSAFRYPQRRGGRGPELRNLAATGGGTPGGHQTYRGAVRSSPELDALTDDCLHLLMTAAALRHRATSFDLRDAQSRLDIHLWMNELRALENDLIVRLCRFDDDGRNQTGLRTALRSLEKEMTDQESKHGHVLVKSYRRQINPLKTQKRNMSVVHLEINTTQPHDAVSLFDLRGVLEQCRQAVHAVDAIAGSKIDYNLQSGSNEIIDLREFCLIDET
jgi:hypothetical protein